MTVATSNSRVDFVGNNSTATYNFSFPIFASTDLEVYEDGVLLTLTTDYTVTLDGDAPNTGHITLVAGNLGNGIALAIVRNVPATQGVDLVDNDPFPAETVEAELDRLTMLVQQNKESLERALKLAPSSTESDVTLEDLDGNAGLVARVNDDEDGIEWVDVVDSGSITVPVSIADGGTGQTTADAALAALQTVEDARTNTVKAKVYKATTSGSPAAGIGAGEKFQAESADEAPSDVGEHQFVFSDVGAGTEDSYWQLLLRVAGAALTAVYRFVATGAFKAIFTHANSADRTYTLPNASGTVALTATSFIATTGDIRLTLKTTPDTGWLMADDGTIGDATSGASNRANADTEALFTLLWNNLANAEAPVVTGRGANAAADFAAHKKITLPKMLGRALGVAGAGSGLTSRVLGLATGAEANAIALANLPNSVKYGTNFNGSVNANGSSAIIGLQSDGVVIGGDTALSVMQPSSFLNVMIKL